MDTNRNRPQMLAVLLRGAVDRLIKIEKRVDPDAAFVRAQELALIGGVANELDGLELMHAPDPARTTSSVTSSISVVV